MLHTLTYLTAIKLKNDAIFPEDGCLKKKKCVMCFLSDAVFYCTSVKEMASLITRTTKWELPNKNECNKVLVYANDLVFLIVGAHHS